MKYYRNVETRVVHRENCKRLSKVRSLAWPRWSGPDDRACCYCLPRGLPIVASA